MVLRYGNTWTESNEQLSNMALFTTIKPKGTCLKTVRNIIISYIIWSWSWVGWCVHECVAGQCQQSHSSALIPADSQPQVELWCSLNVITLHMIDNVRTPHCCFTSPPGWLVIIIPNQWLDVSQSDFPWCCTQSWFWSPLGSCLEKGDYELGSPVHWWGLQQEFNWSFKDFDIRLITKKCSNHLVFDQCSWQWKSHSCVHHDPGRPMF